MTSPKPATSHTKARNAELADRLPFHDTEDFDLVHRGFIAPLPTTV